MLAFLIIGESAELNKIKKYYDQLKEDYKMEKEKEIKNRSMRQPTYAFGQLLTGDSVIGTLSEDNTKIEQALRINFHLDENGQHHTQFSPLLAFDQNIFPTISNSKLLCDPVPLNTSVDIYESIGIAYQNIISRTKYSHNHSIYLN